jgi:hypothetical protein
MWEIYQRNMRKKSPPERLHWIGVDTQYMRKRDDYSKVARSDLTSEDLRRMRLGLGTALLLRAPKFMMTSERPSGAAHSAKHCNSYKT